eukprot:gene26672-65139_t
MLIPAPGYALPAEAWRGGRKFLLRPSAAPPGAWVWRPGDGGARCRLTAHSPYGACGARMDLGVMAPGRAPCRPPSAGCRTVDPDTGACSDDAWGGSLVYYQYRWSCNPIRNPPFLLQPTTIDPAAFNLIASSVDLDILPDLVDLFDFADQYDKTATPLDLAAVALADGMRRGRPTPPALAPRPAH